MVNTFIVNKAPAPNTVGNVSDGIRMSFRSITTTINRSSLNLFLGYGKAGWGGGILPENNPTGAFILDRLYGNVAPYPDSHADIDLEPYGWVKIDKYKLGDEQLSWYSFGRLESPAAKDDLIMLEFSAKVNEADTVADVQNFTGVIFGLFIGKTGFMLKYYNDQLTSHRWFEMHSADYTLTSAPNSSFISEYDWDGNEDTFKILWNPTTDKVTLYRSVGQNSNVTDEILIEGNISDLQPVPDDQIRENLPIAFFGHGFKNSTSISYWKFAGIYHSVTKGISEGIFQGNHEGYEISDSSVEYIPEKLPERSFPAWFKLPNSFGLIDGEATVYGGYLTLIKNNSLASFGYYREEPAVKNNFFILDIEMSGEVWSQGVGIQSTGMEIYVSDGAKALRLALLYDYVATYIGFLNNLLPPNYLEAYVRTVFNWEQDHFLRIIFNSSGLSSLYEVVNVDGGLRYEKLVDTGYSILPTDDMPGPGVGIIHNGNIGIASGALSVKKILYFPNSEIIFGTEVPTSPDWSLMGSGSAYVENELLYIENNGFYRRIIPSTALQPRNGYTIEFSMFILSYGVDNPQRSNTGIGVSIDDGSDRVEIRFADAGPEIGKIVYLPDSVDYEASLNKIRMGDVSMTGRYVLVDWEKFKTYRFERVVGGNIRLFINDSNTPSIDIKGFGFSYLPTTGTIGISFGNINSVYAKSVWNLFMHSLSLGIDVKIDQIKNYEDKFNSIVNVIADFEQV